MSTSPDVEKYQTQNEIMATAKLHKVSNISLIQFKTFIAKAILLLAFLNIGFKKCKVINVEYTFNSK